MSEQKTLNENLFTFLLDRVLKPGRYIGNEINSIKKSLDTQIKFCLVYPDLYEVGMANLAIKILYEVLNRLPFVAAERSFLPDIDMQNLLLKKKIPLFSLENRLFLNTFDFIGITIQTELTATNILQILKLSKIPVLRKNRREKDPIIIGGGPCMANPEPFTDFFDLFVIGDGEKILPEIMSFYSASKDSKNYNKKDFIKSISELKGIYVPWIQKPVYPAVVEDLDSIPFPVSQIVTLIQIPQDRAYVEIARGCLNNCRFCQAGMFYRPLRERSVNKITELVRDIINQTGYSSISLLSLSISNYSNISELMKRLTESVKGVSFSLPSLRIDSFGLNLLEYSRDAKKTGLTFAIESFSPKVQRFINKEIDINKFYEIIKEAINRKWKNIKIYLMYGFPFEEEVEENINGMNKLADFVKQLNSSVNITFHLTPFIPKAQTPLQYMQQQPRSVLKEKLEMIKKSVKKKNITLKWHNIDMAFVESVLATSGREGGKFILKAWKRKAQMDAWDDRFKKDVWLSVLKNIKIEKREPLLFEHINMNFSKEWLKKEMDKAKKGELTPPCTVSSCSGCGACSGKLPYFSKKDSESLPLKDSGTPLHSPSDPYFHLLVRFIKRGYMKYLSHLDLVGIFEKALRRIGLPLRFTFGHNPRPKLVFGDPLALGIESNDEFFFTELWEKIDTDSIIKDLNSFLPEGLSVFEACYVENRKKISFPEKNIFTVVFKSKRSAIKLKRPEIISKIIDKKVIQLTLFSGYNIFKELNKAGIKKEEILSIIKERTDWFIL